MVTYGLWSYVYPTVEKWEKFSKNVEKWRKSRKVACKKANISTFWRLQHRKRSNLPEIILGNPQKILDFDVLEQLMFYCIFQKEFAEVFKTWSFMSGIFFKLPKISKKKPINLPTFFEIEKNYNFYTQIIPELLYWYLYFKNLNFSKILPPSAPKICNFMYQKPDFLS